MDYETKYKELLSAAREYLDAKTSYKFAKRYGQPHREISSRFWYAEDILEELVSDEQN